MRIRIDLTPWIRIRIELDFLDTEADPYRYWKFRSGSRRAQIDTKKRKNLRISVFKDLRQYLKKAACFDLSLRVLTGGLNDNLC